MNQDPSIAEQKTHVMKGLLGHKQTAKMIKEALNAPMGSTKRTYAKNVVSIMKKLHPYRNDGTGGPGGMVPEQVQPSMTQMPPTQDAMHVPVQMDDGSPKGLVVFPKLPQMNVGPHKGNSTSSMYSPRPKTFDGMGGPGDGSSSTNNGGLSLMPNIQSSSANNPFTSLLNSFTSSIPPASSFGLPLPTPSQFSQQPGWGDTAGVPSVNASPVSQNLNIQGGALVPSHNPSSMPAQSPGSLLQPGQNPFQPLTPVSFGQPAQQGNQNPQPTNTSGTTGSSQSGGAPTSGGDQPPAVSSAYPGVQSAVNSNMGGGMYALNALNDPNNPLTHGQSLQSMMDSNAASLDAKYGVTSLRNNLSNLQTEGAGIGTQLNDYIVGRDQFLKDIQGSIDSYTTQALTQSNLADPNQVSANQNYLNYLYTMKGNQQQRYVDFYNGAITQFNGELSAATNNYGTALQAYQNDLNQTDQVTSAQYSMYAQAFSDMYTAVDGAPAKAAQLQNYKLQNQLLGKQIIAAGVKNQTTQDYLGDFSKIKTAGQIIDSNGYVMPNVDLLGQISTLASLDPSMPSSSIYQAYTDGVMRTLNSPTSKTGALVKNTDGEEITGSYKLKIGTQALKQYQAVAQAAASSGDNADVTNAYNQAVKISSQMGSVYQGELSGNGQAIIQAINKLHPGKTFGLFGGATPTKDSFIKSVTSATPGSLGGNGGNTIGSNFASTLYDVFDGLVKAGETPQKAVSDMLYNNVSTNNRATPTPYTPSEMEQLVGQWQASQDFVSVFGQAAATGPGSTAGV